VQSVPEVQTDMTVLAFSSTLRRICGIGASSGVAVSFNGGGEVDASPLTMGSAVANWGNLVVSVRRL